MKQLLLLATVLVAGIVNAQKKYGEYASDYWPDKKTFNIEVSDNKGKLDAVWIDVRTLDNLTPKGSIKVTIKKLPDFIEFLNSAKSKYEEWSKTAKESNVEDVNKEIDIKKFSTTVAFEYGKWQFTTSPLKPRFLLSKGIANLIFGTGSLTSSSNQFMKSDGLALIFTNIDEINEFINALDANKMQEFLDSEGNKKDLFK